MYPSLCLILLLVLIFLVNTKPLKRRGITLNSVYIAPPPRRPMAMPIPLATDYLDDTPRSKLGRLDTTYGVTADDFAWYSTVYSGGVRTNLN